MSVGVPVVFTFDHYHQENVSPFLHLMLRRNCIICRHGVLWPESESLFLGCSDERIAVSGCKCPILHVLGIHWPQTRNKKYKKLNLYAFIVNAIHRR